MSFNEDCGNAEHPSTKLFRDYVRIPSVHPDPDYQQTVKVMKLSLHFQYV